MLSLALKNIQASLTFLLSPSLAVLVAQKNIFFVLACTNFRPFIRIFVTYGYKCAMSCSFEMVAE